MTEIDSLKNSLNETRSEVAKEREIMLEERNSLVTDIKGEQDLQNRLHSQELSRLCEDHGKKVEELTKTWKDTVGTMNLICILFASMRSTESESRGGIENCERRSYPQFA